MNKNQRTDWESVAWIVCGMILVILCWGEPDLLDAIIARVHP